MTRALHPLITVALAGVSLLPSAVAVQRDAWPAEAEERASNLSALEPAFEHDLSGAVWNPVTRTLWLCRNGPGADSRLWMLAEDDEGALRISSDGERPAEWRGLGDSEGVTFADFAEDVVYLIVEGEEAIHELDVSTYGETVVRRVYDTRPFLPLDGKHGAEGITFVPDEHLARSGFTDSRGASRVSRQGLGGLMFVGHQNGGGLYAFDLNRTTGAVDFVGEYRVGAGGRDGAPARSKVVALEFDRSTGALYVWHGLRNDNALSVVQLASTALPGETFRQFTDARTWSGPSDRSYEGLALVPTQDCGADGRALFLTVDDGGRHSLFRYGIFTPGCEGVREEESERERSAESEGW